MQLFRLPHLVVMMWTIEIHNDDVIMTVEIVMVIEHWEIDYRNLSEF